jgi:hypothetical protein
MAHAAYCQWQDRQDTLDKLGVTTPLRRLVGWEEHCTAACSAAWVIECAAVCCTMIGK